MQRDFVTMDVKKETIAQLAEKSFKSVFRTTIEAPGFVHLVFNKEEFTPFQFRALMIALKKEISKHIVSTSQQKLSNHWLVRFDQQVDTPFHVDNAAAHSILMLGYEPSEVESELQLADYHAYAQKTFEKPTNYFHKFTPIFKDDEEKLIPFITKIKINTKEQYSIVIMNNSSPTLEATTLGVFHKAIMLTKDAKKSRIVNSMVLNIVPEESLTDDTAKENLFLHHTLIHT